MPFTCYFHSWAGAYTVGGVSPGDLNRSLSCLSLISTSPPHALQSMLTPKSPGYIPGPSPHHLLQATVPSLCFCSWQSS